MGERLVAFEPLDPAGERAQLLALHDADDAERHDGKEEELRHRLPFRSRNAEAPAWLCMPQADLRLRSAAMRLDAGPCG
jgi:hypothetical protein